jgi:glycerol-3-phosphate dehydrogenase (NAD+)
LDSASEGISLISKVIEEELSIPCHVLMGANLAGEVAREMFVEATIGTIQALAFSLFIAHLTSLSLHLTPHYVVFYS